MTLILPPMAIETPRVLFDLSRLLRQRGRRFPTGVDRIDLAIGRQLAERFGEACVFVHASPTGPAPLPHAVGARLLDLLERRWRSGGSAAPETEGLRRAIASGRLRAALGGFRALATPETTYVNACHSGLPRLGGGLERVDPDRRMRRLAYIHDIIPLEHPEYQTPQSVARFERFLRSLTTAPVRFHTNSADTARRLSAYADAQGWTVEGIEASIPRLAALTRPAAGAGALRPEVRAVLESSRPYCIAIGTIEPRKNHLLLLHVWREFAAEPEPPLLVVVGRRGWENEMVVDMLDRCAAIAPHVAEFGDLSDAETMALLAGARALLFPSFAEGLGLPLLEAAALGTPCVVSDLPAFREVAPEGARFLSPIDGPAWKRAVRDMVA